MAVATVRNDALAPSAGAGCVADAGDVSGNDIPLGGGNDAGDATMVESATLAAGVAQGTIPVAGTATGLPDGGQGGGQGTGQNGGQGNHGPVASDGDDDHQAGQANADHGCGGHSGGDHVAVRPVPSFWNFVENELAHEHANSNHHQLELTWHHA